MFPAAAAHRNQNRHGRCVDMDPKTSNHGHDGHTTKRTIHCAKMPEPIRPERPSPSRISNIFTPPPAGDAGEQLTTLLETPDFRLEHIVSNGQATKTGWWYDQPGPEWVMLLRGTAKLRFEGEGPLDLNPGDALLIPAHSKHRVESCSPDALWLALHFRPHQP